MGSQLRIAPFVSALLLLASTGLATDHLKLKSGKVLVGSATAYDPETNIVTFVTQEAEVLRIKAQDLDTLSAYKLAKAKAEKGNAAHQLAVGHVARDVELFKHAKRHYDSALKLDPSLAEEIEQARARLRAEAASFCMRHAREALAKKDAREAEEWLTTLVEKLPDEPLAAEAALMLAET